MLDDKAFRFWNVKSNCWEIEGGEYELLQFLPKTFAILFLRLL